MSPLLSHLLDFWVLCIRQLLNKEFGIFPDYLQSSIELNTLKLVDVGIAKISVKNRLMPCMNFSRYLDTIMAL